MIQPLRDDLMVQEQLPAKDHVTRVWQHMVAVIMLNQTGRKPVKTVLPIFLHKWPRPIDFLLSTPDQAKEVIWPLGMGNVRENRLRKMTTDFVYWWNFVDATQLYGIGKYGSDSYEIFFNQNYSVQPTDKELKRYLLDKNLVDVNIKIAEEKCK